MREARREVSQRARSVDGSSPADSVMRELWQLIDLQEWDELRGLLHPDVRVDYVHTGESFGLDAYVALNRDYPGTWRTELVDVVSDASHAAACVRVTDGRETHYVASFGTVADGLITKLVEVWAEAGAEVPVSRRPERA